jgi:hypothetical protein
MKTTLSMCVLLIPAFALGNDVAEFSSENPESATELSSESSYSIDASSQSARVQVAHAVKRDAERYLAGSEMTRVLSLRLEQLQSDNRDLDSDELVERALDEAVEILTKRQDDSADE